MQATGDASIKLKKKNLKVLVGGGGERRMQSFLWAVASGKLNCFEKTAI